MMRVTHVDCKSVHPGSIPGVASTFLIALTLHSRALANRGSPLRQHQDACDHDGREDRRGDRAAESEPAMVKWLVEEVTQGRAERPRYNERSSEQQNARYVGPVVQCSSDR